MKCSTLKPVAGLTGGLLVDVDATLVANSVYGMLRLPPGLGWGDDIAAPSSGDLDMA